MKTAIIVERDLRKALEFDQFLDFIGFKTELLKSGEKLSTILTKNRDLYLVNYSADSSGSNFPIEEIANQIQDRLVAYSEDPREIERAKDRGINCYFHGDLPSIVKAVELIRVKL